MAAQTESSAEQRSAGAVQKALHVVVVTPEKTLLDDRADFVSLPLYDGELGVLPGRAPLIGRLGYGELRTRVADQTRRYYVDGGFAQVRDNVVTVLTNRALAADAIDASAATRELEQAQEKLARTDHEFADKQKAIARSRAMLRVRKH